MSMHNDPKPKNGHDRAEMDTTFGYERTDVRSRGIVVFLTALMIFVAVAGILCYGMGKVLNWHMTKEDGPTSKWSKTADVRQLGNLASSPELQKKLASVTQQFPAPRLQTDDGSQDVVDLHAREDLLLENYTWVDRAQGKARIPIERAMELIAERGLPVAPAEGKEPRMTGDRAVTVATPLTDGFTRTGYEQEQEEAVAAAAARQR